MKIGILIDELAPGSAPKLIGQSVRGLRKLGHTCDALVIINNRKQEQFSKVYNYHLSGIKVRYLFDEVPAFFRKVDFKFPGFSFFSLHHILSLFLAPFLIKNREYDILIVYSQYSTFTAQSLRLLRGIPYLLLVWDPSAYTLKKIYAKTKLRVIFPLLLAFAYLLDKFASFGAKALITSGKLHHERFSNISGKPLEDLYPGCFVKERFVPYSEREKAILAYDRWDIGNKPNVFLNVLSSLEEDIKLKIGGFWHPESIKKNFVAEIKNQGLETRIELLGALDEQMILDLCSRVVLHVHPNEEAFGMQTLEAAACGCCIIIPDGSGVTDIFEHGVHGYFPPKSDFAALAGYIKMVFSDIAKAEAMGKRAWEKSKGYDWVNYSRRLEQIIKKYV